MKGILIFEKVWINLCVYVLSFKRRENTGTHRGKVACGGSLLWVRVGALDWHRASWAWGTALCRHRRCMSGCRQGAGPRGLHSLCLCCPFSPQLPQRRSRTDEKVCQGPERWGCASVSHMHLAHTAPSQPALPGTSWGTLCPQTDRATSCGGEGTSVGGAALSLYIPLLEHASQMTKSLFLGWTLRPLRAGTQPYSALSLVSI